MRIYLETLFHRGACSEWHPFTVLVSGQGITWWFRRSVRERENEIAGLQIVTVGPSCILGTASLQPTTLKIS